MSTYEGWVSRRVTHLDIRYRVFPLKLDIVVWLEVEQPALPIEGLARAPVAFRTTRSLEDETNTEAHTGTKFGADGLGSPSTGRVCLGRVFSV